ncbi:MAG: DNA/RNA non-specific endonuclease [Bacteroidota bacterium]
MADFRKNHKRSNGTSNFSKSGLFALIVAVLFYLFNQGAEGGSEGTGERWELPFPTEEKAKDTRDTKFKLHEYLPTSTTGQMVQHQYYTLSYNEQHEQPEWVAYELTKKSIQAPNVKRTGDFRQDPKVKTGSAELYDYRGSGYDRGHLAPAGDMAFNKKAMSESFYLSNMSPQARQFNGGIWRELEELTRDWAYKFKKLYVVTGPLFDQPVKGRIGDNEVSIPSQYYKVLLDLEEPEQKGIAFILDNQVNFEPLYKFAVPIDVVEARTGIDFFPELMDETLEARIESNSNVDLWPFNKKKYDLRNSKWNNR